MAADIWFFWISHIKVRARRIHDPIKLNQTSRRKSKKKKKMLRAERTDCTCYVGNSLVQLTQTKNTSFESQDWARLNLLLLLLLLMKIPVKRRRAFRFLLRPFKIYSLAWKLRSIPLSVSSLDKSKYKTPFKVAPCWRDPKAMFPICRILPRDF